MRAVFLYEKGEELPELNPMIKMAFNFIKQDLDRNAEKYEQKRKSCSEAGKKSAETRKSQKETKLTDASLVTTNSTDVNEAERVLTKSTDNENNYADENSSVNENANVDVNDDVFISKREDEIQQVIDEFNSRCSKLDKVTRITPSREKAIIELMKGYTTEEIKNTFDKINQSDYLWGKTKGGFKAQFDWIIKPDIFPRIFEGGYSCSGKSDKKRNGERVYDYEELMKWG